MAGFFGFFDYTKPGKGINKDEPPKAKFLLFFELFFRKFWNFLKLNLMFIVASIPILALMFLFAPITAATESGINFALYKYNIVALPYLAVVGFGLIMPGFTYILRN